MQRYKQLFYLLILVGWMACTPNNTGETDPIPNPDSSQTKVPLEVLQISGTPISLVVTTQQAIIRAEPSLEAPELARFNKGDSLLFTNRVSGFNTPIKLEGIQYNEPWLRIIMEGNQMGWVYGGSINFKAKDHLQLKEKVLDQRAVALFGKSLAQQMAIYQKETQSTSTLSAFRTLFTRAENLKDSLEERMNIYVQTSNSKELPNFFWLNELMDGMLVHYIPTQHRYYLFRDLKVWQQISLNTLEPQDDAFVELLLASYPSDSIEYYFYGWQLPVDSTTMCSMLGSNIHHHVFDKIELAMDSLGYFKEEIEKVKQAIVDDISISDHYWLPLERIQAELSAIIQRKYAYMAPSDFVALKTRQKMLDNSSQNNIALNLFEGK